jgi:hypothetical protein
VAKAFQGIAILNGINLGFIKMKPRALYHLKVLHAPMHHGSPVSLYYINTVVHVTVMTIELIDEKPNVIKIFYERAGLAALVEEESTLVMSEKAISFCSKVIEIFNKTIYPHQILRLANSDTW